MDKIKAFFKTLYLNTFKDKEFRKITLYTRIKVYIFLSLLIAFFANLYIYGAYKEPAFIIFMIMSTLISYFLFLFININKSNHDRSIKLISLISYLIIEIIIVCLILIGIYFYIKSLVL